MESGEENELLAALEYADTRAFRSGFRRFGRTGARGFRRRRRRGIRCRFFGLRRELVFFFEFLAGFDRNVDVLRLISALRQIDLMRTRRDFRRIL